MAYNNKSPWPTDADGTGKTLELIDPSGDLNEGLNWFSGCIGGSPGEPFFECDTIYINEHLDENHIIKLYPNPFNNKLTIEIFTDQSNEMQIELFDVMGNLKFNEVFFVQAGQLNIFEFFPNELKSGVYLTRIFGNNINHTTKVIVR
jgi:hypothetical protein